MPPQAKPFTAAAETLQSVAEQLNVSEAAAAKSGSPGSSKCSNLTKLWTLIIQSNAKQQEDLLKPLPPSKLLTWIEEAPREPQLGYAAAGCLAALAHHPKWLAELTVTPTATHRLVCACQALLSGPHDRSRLPAVQLMQAVARCPLQVPRLTPLLPQLLSLLSEEGGPGWVGGRQLAAAAAAVLAALLAPSECEAAAAQQARRVTCLSSGAVPSLLGLMQGGPAGGGQLPAAACLRYLALAPGAAAVMAGDPGIAAQLLLLLSAGPSVLPAVLSYVSGILWELAASVAAAEQLLAAGAVPALIRVVQGTAPLVVRSGGGRKKGGKKPKKGGKARDKSGGKAAAGKQDAGGGNGGKDGKAAAAGAAAGRQGSQAGCVGEVCAGPSFTLLQDPQAAAEVALCNAAGALHHLSFLDGAKAQVGQSSHLHLLVTLASSTQGQMYDNLVGLLWNVGLLDTNQPLLAAAGAPGYLVQPIPARWTTLASSCGPTAAAAAVAGNAPVAAAVPAAGGVAAAGAGSHGEGYGRQTTIKFVHGLV